MKKLLLLTVLIVIASCSSDDEKSRNSNDPLIGKWTRLKSVYHLDNGELCEYDYMPQCPETPSTWEYKSNSEIIRKIYENDDSEPGCELLLRNGTWERIGESLYKLKDNSSGESNNLEVYFNDDNTMFIRDNDTGISCSEPFTGEDQYFKRIN